jgi:hypothetical protein
VTWQGVKIAPTCRRVGTALAAAVAVLGPACRPAQAETSLDARYAISVAGLIVGEGIWTVRIDKDRYSTRADGTFTGIWRLLAGGEVFSSASGNVRGRLSPTRYEANFALDEAIEAVRMSLRDGAVKDLAVEPPLPDVADRVPVGEADRRGVTDPLTAGLMAAPAAGDVLAPGACERTLAMFDGGHRYDMVLSFKRMDEVKAVEGYRGPVVVCAMAYRPISGHSPSGYRVKHLMGRRGMEMWLAPIASTRLLAPFRIAVPTLLGTAMLDAVKFESAVKP